MVPLRRSLSSVEKYSQRPEIAGLSPMKFEQYTTIFEVYESKRTRICKYGCFRDSLVYHQQHNIDERNLGYKHTTEIIKRQRSCDFSTCVKAARFILEISKSPNADGKHYK
ncbi:hypothetical protein AYI69_g1772 [Smittium culicis]|uniref:Uncharacterized protein n=1 Tax=Smittium culicis TaxID=133412 RepID=A0A1R1YPH8_9FUNG|nr:hypothetical protein AYI69_g1772 [Smittium culicis]